MEKLWRSCGAREREAERERERTIIFQILILRELFVAFAVDKLGVL